LPAKLAWSCGSAAPNGNLSMKIRSFLTIVLLFAGLLAILPLFIENRQVWGQEVRLWGGATTNVGITIFAFFFVGVLITALVRFSRGVSWMLERSELRKVSRKTEEVEDEYSRGLVAVLEGRQDEALGHFRAVLERDSRHFNTLIKIGEVLRDQEKHEQAIEYHAKAHHLKEDDTRPLYALVEDHEAKGDLERARVVLGKIISINKNSVIAWRKLRSLHVKERRWKNALEAHQRVVRLSAPSDPHHETDRNVGLGIRYEIAVQQTENGKPRDAISGLRRLVKDDPRFIPAAVKLGEALLDQGRESDAVQTWRDGFCASGSPVFLSVIEDFFLRRERPTAAIDSLKRCVADSPDSPARFFLGKLYWRLEMLDEAFEVLSAITGRSACPPGLHYLLGRINERRGQHDAAAREYCKLIEELDPIQPDYRCRSCCSTALDWAPRCPSCGEWNGLEAVPTRASEMRSVTAGPSGAPTY